jgi:hypothetical protein
MIFTENIAQLFSLNTEFAVFKWDTENRITVLNGVIGSIPKSEMINFIISAATTSMLEAYNVNPHKALKNILGVSGPVLFTRAIGTFIAEKEKQTTEFSQISINVERVANMYKYWVKNGPDFLKKPLEYKSTDLHWLIAAKNNN